MANSNIVSFKNAGLPHVKNLAAGLANARTELKSSASIGGLFIRLSREGYWVYGPDNLDYEPGALLAVNPASFSHGWILWGDGVVEGEVMVSIQEPCPPRPGEGYDQQFSVMFQVLTGPDKGEALVYKGTSLGLKKAFGTLIGEVAEQLKDDPEHYVPVVTLDIDHYQHKKYGKIYTPIISVQKWVSMAGSEEAVQEEEPEQEEEAEKKASKVTRRRRRQAH